MSLCLPLYEYTHYESHVSILKQIKSQCLEISLMHINSCKVANEDEGMSVEDQKKTFNR